MSIETERTPGKVHVINDSRVIYISSFGIIGTGDVCDFYHKDKFTGEIFIKENAKANAKFMSLAWNCHDDLVKTLKLIMFELRDEFGNKAYEMSTYKLALEAFNRVKKERE